MVIKKSFAVIAVLCVMVSALLFTERTLRAQETISGSAIAKKLDEILNNQKVIMQNLESLRTELNIVKIRVTQQQ